MAFFYILVYMVNKIIKISLCYSLLWLLSLFLISLFVIGSIVPAFGSISVSGVMFLCLFTLFQTAMEEAIFRLIPLFAYRSFITHCKTSRAIRLLFIVLPSVVFSLLHISNKEVAENSNWIFILLIYFFIGCYYMYITIRHNSIFPSWGMHYMNNIFTFAIVSTASSSSPFNSLYICTIKEDNILFMLSSLAFSIVFTQIGYRIFSSLSECK
ncbi:MAG: CPBP family intramembrane glutamic endopeptidase [Sphaerochaetaceae bacterium]|nr:CPBP family intramembrane glutamic endopeptidase [Sphaerochaetaceae bacterium]